MEITKRRAGHNKRGEDGEDGGFIGSLKKSLGKALGSRIASLGGPLLGGMKKGGKVKKTGVYKLHAGETVVPAGVDPAVAHHRKHKLGHKN